MKKLVMAIFALALLSSLAVAEGGMNHGTIGSGNIYTGSNSQGTGTQQRTGR